MQVPAAVPGFLMFVEPGNLEQQWSTLLHCPEPYTREALAVKFDSTKSVVLSDDDSGAVRPKMKKTSCPAQDPLTAPTKL
jgi:hypothetical protein